MTPLSVCIIAKNEEDNIRQCLESLQQLQCEIILVDTGSTDSTLEIAKEYAVSLYSYVWTNDFSAARNFAISKASHDWILVLDCDEQIESCDLQECLKLAQEHPDRIGILKIVHLMQEDSLQGAYSSSLGRWFHRKYYHYTGTIHEQLTPLSEHVSGSYPLPLTLLHYGYIESRKQAAAKHERNISLLKQALSRNADNPYYLYQLGQEYFNTNRFAEALPYYEKSLSILKDRLSPDVEYHRLLAQSYANSLLCIGRVEEALQYQDYETLFGTVPDYYFLLGRIYCACGKPLEAMMQFIKAISMDNPRIEGTNTYLCWYHMGLINEELGEPSAAKTYYEKCGDYAPALERLALIGEQPGR